MTVLEGKEDLKISLRALRKVGASFSRAEIAPSDAVLKPVRR
jgi:hypothetical protein